MPEVDETFHKTYKGRKIENSVAEEMMELKLIEVKEATEEVRCRKTETVLKMGGENYHFAWIGHRLALLARNSAKHLFRYHPRPVQPINICLAHIRASPGAARVRREAWAGTLIRSTDFFLHLVKFFFPRCGLLIYSFFFAQRDLGLPAKLSATGKLHVGLFGSHLSKLLELPNNKIPNRYSLAKI
jgi:hypothetical protein